MPKRFISPIAAIGAACVLASAAQAAETPPSRAPLVAVGESFTTSEGGPDLWRLSASIRPGDELQLAVAFRGGLFGAESCLIGPVGDGEYERALAEACARQSSQGRIGHGQRPARFYLEQSGAEGMPLIFVSGLQTTVTVEGIIRFDDPACRAITPTGACAAVRSAPSGVSIGRGRGRALGAVWSGDPSCRNERRVRLHRAGRTRVLATARTRQDGSFRLPFVRAAATSKIRVTVPARTTGSTVCGATRSIVLG